MYVLIIKICIIFTLFISYAHASIVHLERPKEKDRYGKLRITEKNYQAVKNVHVNWYTTSLKALMGQMGKHLYETLSKDEKRRLGWCLDQIEEKHDIVYSAKCLVQARKRFQAQKEKVQKTPESQEHFSNFKQDSKNHEWVGSFKVTDDLRKEQFRKSFMKKSKDIQRYPQRGYVRRIGGFVVSENTQNAMISHKKLDQLMWLSNNKRKMVLPVYRHQAQASLQTALRPTSFKGFDIGKPKMLNIVPVIPSQQKRDLIQMPVKSLKFGITMVESHPKDLESKHFEFNRKYSTNYPFEKYRMKRSFQRRFFAHRIKRSPYRLIDHDLQDDKYAPEFKVKQMSKLSKLNSNVDRSPVSKFANFLRQFVHLKNNQNDKTSETIETGGSELVNGKWPKTYKTLLKLHKEMEKQKKLPGAKPYKLRMYDIVIGNNEPTLSPKDRRGPAGLLQQGMKLIQSIQGANKTNEREGMNIRFFSPRFMPLMPDKVTANKMELLSPTILSFYKDNRGIAPLPDILDSFGMSSIDRESILSMLMDVTESTTHVNSAIQLLKDINFFDVGPEIMKSTERITEVYDNLENSLKHWQKEHLDRKGYTFLEKKQLEKVYRDYGVGNEIDISDIDDYANYTHEQREMALWSTIEQIAKNITSPDAHRRQKRLGQFPVFYLAPVVLGPYAFAPTYGLSILGPLVLSPFIFSPLIINPSVLSPFILSPGVAVPLILSPYIFGPFILGPYVMMPFILSPYVLSPNVLNPYVLSPLILSPTVLSPDILSPQVLGGGVLSPTVGSPSVLTETTLMASFLSPSFLS